MTKYDPVKVKLVKEWIKLVESKRKDIKNVIAYAKTVYDGTEAMDSWDEIRGEVEKAKIRKSARAKMFSQQDINHRANQALMDRLKNIPKDQYEELRKKAIDSIKSNPNYKFLLKNFNPDSGFGKSMLEIKIIEAFKNESRI